MGEEMARCQLAIFADDLIHTCLALGDRGQSKKVGHGMQRFGGSPIRLHATPMVIPYLILPKLTFSGASGVSRI
jgi:hypothetical protein